MNITKSIVLLIVIFTILSCTKKNVYNEKEQVVITGKIHKYNGKNAKLNFIYSQPGVNESTELIEIDSTGYFELRFYGYIPLDAMLLEKTTFANINFIYHPGDSIHIEFEAKNKEIELLKTINYSGSRAKTNNQINNFRILREENNLGYGAINQAKSYEKKVADFILEMNSVKEKQLNLYKTFVEKHKPSNDVKNWAALYTLETYYYFLDMYGLKNKNLPNKYFDYNNEILPITMDKLICWKIVENRISSSIQLNLFPRFAEQNSNIDILTYLTDKTTTSDSLFINFVHENYTDNLQRQLILSGIYKRLISMNSLESYQRNRLRLEKEISTPFISFPLQENYNKTQILINNSPKEKSAMILKKMIGSAIEETFNKILEDNKGKVIYLDCWATWCKPCKDEMPSSKLLMSKFEQQKVAFVYLCFDKNDDERKKILSEFGLERGQHYQLNNKQVQVLYDAFQFNAIPYYILIDKDGQITESGN